MVAAAVAGTAAPLYTRFSGGGESFREFSWPLHRRAVLRLLLLAMSYLTRTFGRRNRHDPSTHGIFIHGGTNDRPKWDSPRDPARRYRANRFSLTLPSCTPQHQDTSPAMLEIRALRFPEQRTFQRAVEQAVKLRRKCPVLTDCAIYACTDFQMDHTAIVTKGRLGSCGMLAIQLVLPPDEWPASAFCEVCLTALAEAGFASCDSCSRLRPGEMNDQGFIAHPACVQPATLP